MNKDTQYGHYFNSYGFIRAYIHLPSREPRYIGGISSRAYEESIEEWHIEMCQAIEKEVGKPIFKCFGGYYSKPLKSD